MQLSSAIIKEHYNDIFGKHTIADLIICRFDESLEILFASNGVLALMDYQEELVGASYSELVDGRVSDRIFNEIKDSTHTNGVYTEERFLQLKNGKKIWVMERGGVISLDGSITILKIIITDISKQKEIEENLRISEKRYELVMNFSDVSVFDYDMKTRRMVVTYLDADNYGMPQVMENMPYYAVEAGIILPKSANVFLGMYKKIFAGEPFVNEKIWTIDINGQERLLELQLVTIYDNDNKPVRAIGVHKDITDKLLLQKEKEYNKAMAASLMFAYEANISTDKLISKNKQWSTSEGVDDIEEFSELVNRLCNKIDDEDYRELFAQKMDKQYIINSWINGQKMISFRFVATIKGQEIWLEKSINIVYDEESDEYLIRCYTDDVTKEQRAIVEQWRYESMISKSKIVYEINVSRNQAISGHENWKELFDIEISNDYTKMINRFATQVIHSEEQEVFLQTFKRENLIREFRKGKMVHACDYRVLNEADNWCWMRCTLNLFEDPELGYIRGFSYVDDIDDDKKKELEILYRSQHDLLSGLYNKNTVEEKIDEYLQGNGKNGLHALFVIDLDNFKDINDQFGHVFGDVVISETAAKIKSTFREADLLGRIGGDEFVVLMKNLSQRSIASAKAKQICEITYGSYNKNNQQYNVSASVGIAYYSEHGHTFEELYHNADVAMYNSKEYGRNRLSVYNENMRICYLPGQRQENTILDCRRNFQEYIGVYVFKLLYESAEPKIAIISALELLAKHYNFCRAYIFEDTVSGTYTSNTFEWCQTDVEPRMASLQRISYEQIDNLTDNFDEDGFIILNDISAENNKLHSAMCTQNAKSLVAIAIKQDGNIKGFLGFDSVGLITLDAEQVWDLINLSNIIGLFVIQMRTNEQYARANALTLSVLNCIDAYLYVCNPNTYEIVFANEKIKSIMTQAKPGELCYEVFAGLNQICCNCLLKEFVNSGKRHMNKEYYDKKLKSWFRCNVSWIQVIGQERLCLLVYTDISVYKK